MNQSGGKGMPKIVKPKIFNLGNLAGIREGPGDIPGRIGGAVSC